MAGANDTPVTEVTPPGADAPSADDIFGQVFSELTTEGPVVREGEDANHQDQPGATGAVEVTGDLPTPEEVAAEAAAAGATGASGAAAAAPAGSTGEPGPTGQADQPSMEHVLRSLLAEREAKPPPPQPTPQPDPYKVPDYTAEQKAIVDNYMQEFPEMANAESIIRSREYSAVVGFVFKQVEGPMNAMAQRIQQLEGLLANVNGTLTTQQIEGQIGTPMAGLKPQVEAWIAKQPAYLQGAMKDTLTKGKPEDIVALVTDFRKANPQAVPQPGATGAAGTAGGVVAAPGASGATGAIARPAVKPKPTVPASMRPVPSARTAPETGGIARDDFEGAFAAFSNAGAG